MLFLIFSVSCTTLPALQPLLEEEDLFWNEKEGLLWNEEEGLFWKEGAEDEAKESA